jgi:hypothetical protein
MSCHIKCPFPPHRPTEWASCGEPIYRDIYAPLHGIFLHPKGNAMYIDDLVARIKELEAQVERLSK